MATRNLNELDYYALLKVPRDATADAIKQAFHDFARKYHPDRVAHDARLARQYTRIYRRGTEAYRVLSHPEQRRLYDLGLAAGSLRFDPSLERLAQRPSSPASRGKSGQARPFILKAQQSMRRGDYRGAKLHLMIALGHDPDNSELQAMMREVEAELAR